MQYSLVVFFFLMCNGQTHAHTALYTGNWLFKFQKFETNNIDGQDLFRTVKVVGS